MADVLELRRVQVPLGAALALSLCLAGYCSRYRCRRRKRLRHKRLVDEVVGAAARGEEVARAVEAGMVGAVWVAGGDEEARAAEVPEAAAAAAAAAAAVLRAAGRLRWRRQRRHQLRGRRAASAPPRRRLIPPMAMARRASQPRRQRRQSTAASPSASPTARRQVGQSWSYLRHCAMQTSRACGTASTDGRSIPRCRSRDSTSHSPPRSERRSWTGSARRRRAR
mmetsp:Transcript_35989/g.113031  ORF Transcript_35989/g.113031 Transcript_35989/m.113031 type:complete len:224 (+) Transcript_35989:207-878(+)